MILSHDEITPAVLTELLTASGVAAGAEVVSFESASVGTGQVGENVRYRLTWSTEPGDRPTSVVGKFPALDEKSRATGVATRSYERESQFYAHIADTVDIRIPHCHHVDLDVESGSFMLLLEDLAPRTQGDQLDGCRDGEAEAAVDELVGLHAPRWNDPTLDEHDWMSRRDPESSGATGMIFTAVFDGFVEQIGPHMDEVHVEVARRLLPRIGDWLTPAAGPQSVTHGDYRLDNMLWAPGERLAVVDWQTTGHGSPFTDLAYFIGTGLDGPAQAAHTSDLFDRYVDGLVARGVDVDRAEAWTGVRRGALAGLMMAVVASQIVGQTERGDVMFAAMADRSASLALQLDTFDTF